MALHGLWEVRAEFLFRDCLHGHASTARKALIRSSSALRPVNLQRLAACAPETNPPCERHNQWPRGACVSRDLPRGK